MCIRDSNQPVEDFGLAGKNAAEIADKKTFKTSRPGIFACGNMIREQEMAVRAAAQGRVAASEVSIYLGTQAAATEIHFNSSFAHLSASEQLEYLKDCLLYTSRCV